MILEGSTTDKQHTTLREPCPDCGSLSATVVCYRDTVVVQMIICDSCGKDLR